MSEVTTKIQTEKKSSRWRIWALVIILMIVIVLISIFIYNKAKENQGIKNADIGALKTAKCISECPLESNDDNNSSYPQSECYTECTSYMVEPPPYLWSQKSAIPTELLQCTRITQSYGEKIDCINKLLIKHSDIIDLSSTSLILPYTKISLSIEELNCTSSKIIVKVKLTEGTGIKKILLSVDGLMSQEFSEIPAIGETKIYNLQNTNPSAQVSIAARYIQNARNMTTQFKDIKSCH